MSADGVTVRVAVTDGWCTGTERAAALAALARLEAGAEWQYEMGKGWRERALAAEAQRDALAEALRELWTWQPQTGAGVEALHPQHRAAIFAARAALAEAGLE